MLQNITIMLRYPERLYATLPLNYILSKSDTKRLKIGSIISINQNQLVVTGLEVGNSFIVYVKLL